MIAIVPFAAWLALLIFALLDIDGSPADRVRTMGTAWWVLVVVLLPVVGSVAWIVAGRPRATRAVAGVGPAAQSLAGGPGSGDAERPGVGPIGTSAASLAAILDQIDRDFDRAVRRRQEAAARWNKDGPHP